MFQVWVVRSWLGLDARLVAVEVVVSEPSVPMSHSFPALCHSFLRLMRLPV